MPGHHRIYAQGSDVRQAAQGDLTDLLATTLSRQAGEAKAGFAATLNVGLVGRGIAASRSPVMHELEGRRLGLDYAYHRIDFDALELDDGMLPAVLSCLAELGFVGVNVTHPFKQAALAQLHRLGPSARAIGAVNTVVFDAEAWTGHNTDSWGFAESLRTGLRGARLGSVVLVGAGGAGLAVARALVDLGCGRLAVADRARERAQRLVDSLGGGIAAQAVDPADLPDRLAQADGLVNATPVGMIGHPGLPVPGAAIGPPLWVADIVYFPEETELVRLAERRGCRTLRGTGMAINQAVKAFELFTGRKPDPASMARHFRQAAAVL
ncbi:MAG: shikimate dehydrogenase [Azospirillaceae bacterium]